jgi:hypothetical protein
MSRCQFKSGFFTLRSCNRPATSQCASCGQFACQYHLSAQTEMRLCVSCAEKQIQRQNTSYYDNDWIYSYRGWYYGSGYHPFRYGHHDYSSFNAYNDSIEDYDDDYAGDFSDS